jgi:hypothetical protein
MASSASLYATSSAPPQKAGVTSAIARASEKTGMNFNYLMQKASIESSLNPTAQAKRSTAQGLYQFVEKTWLQMVRDYGPKYGLDKESACIDQNCQVSNATTKRQILNLRRDPELSALMAAEYAQANAKQLEQKVGNITDIGETELYIAHFLGATGAAKFLTAMHENPNTPAVKLFGPEARRNPGVFYADGKAQSFAQIYSRFAAWFEDNTTPTNVIPAQAEIQSQESNAPIDRIAYAEITETPIKFTDAMIKKLLMTPNGYRANATSVASNTAPPAPSTPAVNTALATVRGLQAAQNQSALLVLAQTYAHDNTARYNA